MHSAGVLPLDQCQIFERFLRVHVRARTYKDPLCWKRACNSVSYLSNVVEERCLLLANSVGRTSMYIVFYSI